LLYLLDVYEARCHALCFNLNMAFWLIISADTLFLYMVINNWYIQE